MTKDEQLDYLAGFFDAEGCVYSSDNGKQQQILYSVGQSEPTVLYLFQSVFGGSVRKRAEATDKHKEQWLWMKTCAWSDKFSPMLIERTAIKRRQLGLAIEFCRTLRSVEGRRIRLTASVIEERKTIFGLLKGAKGKLFDREDVVVSEMPIAYWAGMFDGDGSAGLRKNKRRFYSKVSIYSSYVPVLESAKRRFSGNVFEHSTKRAREWRVLHQKAEIFLRLVEPHLIVKASVVRSILALKDFSASSRKFMVCDSRGWNRSFPESVINEMDAMVATIRDLNRRGPKQKVA